MTEKMLLRRAAAVFCTVLLICGVLTVRLFDLAMYDNTSREVLSGQYTRTALAAERYGFVYGSDGQLLSHKENGAFAVVNPGGMTDKNSAVQFLSKYSGVSAEDIIEKVSTPAPFVLHLDTVPVENAPEGMYVCADYAENDNGICRHILGYRDSDGKGRDGIYRRFDSILSGLSGSVCYKYTAGAGGSPIDPEEFRVENRCYTDASGLVLTIDSGLQEGVDKICDKYIDMGAVVVSSLANGEILALSSRPLYDKDDVEASLESDRGELINRAFALYTPGSVFKTVVAAAALEKDMEYKDFEYECTGKCDVYGKEFRCHKASGHGVQKLEEAYANSCNTYFIKLSEKVGFETICEMCEKMGLGEAYAIDGILVPAAKIPDKSKRYPPAYEANFSFGQGDTLMSVIDVLNVFTICSTGFKRDFSLVKGLYDGKSEEMTYFTSSVPERILPDETVSDLLSMMRACITRGTGALAGVGGTKAGGKTATAQTGQFKDGKELTHKWFAGVFPIENPRYAVVVLCDGNGEGNVPPARIFSEVADLVSAGG